VSKIQVSARMKIRPGQLEEFERQAAECIMQVKEKDLGTLQYDWFRFLSSGKTECEIREEYESSEAAHQFNLRKTLQTVFEKFGSAHSVVIYGDPSPELLENAKASGLDIQTFSFLQGL
jgi:quinol monooxygenase YgiN